ncbi:MAG: glucose-6-phosphate dehydrogenase [Candidatus Dormibacteraceae bacterium]
MTRKPIASAASNGSASDALVFFGASGDLAHKKIFPALYAMVKRGELTVPVVGVSFSGWSLDQLKARMADGIEKFGGGIDDKRAFSRLSSLLRYVDGDYGDEGTFDLLKTALNGATRPTHYLAIPPDLFTTVIRGLAAVGLNDGARIIIEKPFGHDLASARRLNRVAHSFFPESAIMRIDHFLGKEAIENIVYFRFANSFLEPIWNRDHVASIQITLAEAFGVQGRGGFYETTGCMRDVIQNHLLQIVALLAMEPPSAMRSDAVRNEKAKVLQAIRPLKSEHLIRGQFRGYRSEPGVAKDSDVETYCALRLQVDSWRWAGVPFYLRSGKCLAETAAEVLVRFKAPPQRLFADIADAGERSNYLRFRLEPGSAIAMGVRVKRVGKELVGHQRELYLQDDHPGEEPPYERLLTDALAGDATLFAREDAVEAAWAAVDPVLRDHQPVLPYRPGSWGPAAARDLIAADGGWHNPVLSPSGAEPYLN